MGKSGFFFWYPDGDPDHSQNLMGSKLDQDPSPVFLSQRSNEQFLHNPTNKQTDKQSLK